jgi:hypothetical protein
LLEDAFSVSSLEVVVVGVAGFSNLGYRSTGCQPAMLQIALAVRRPGADFSGRPFAIGESVVAQLGLGVSSSLFGSSRPFAVVF